MIQDVYITSNGDINQATVLLLEMSKDILPSKEVEIITQPEEESKENIIIKEKSPIPSPIDSPQKQKPTLSEKIECKS